MSGNQIKTLGFVGLGVMGAPMAGHLLKSGMRVLAYNRSHDKAQAWQTRFPQGETCTSLEQLASQVDVVSLCVGNDADVRETVGALLPHLRAGAVILDHTTTSSALAQEMHALCATRDVQFLDCPVSGGQAGAENGKLTIMCGGDVAIFERVRPILALYSQYQRHFGASGAGQGAKMVNQILVVNILQGLAEGITLGKALGLDIEALVDTLKRGAANSWQLENRGVTMAQGQFDFGFAVDWAIKDLGIVQDCAQSLGLNLAATQEILSRYQSISAKGHGREDTSALIRQFE
jgi:3-hydroxyisobutyrate dehydrogenase